LVAIQRVAFGTSADCQFDCGKTCPGGNSTDPHFDLIGAARRIGSPFRHAGYEETVRSVLRQTCLEGLHRSWRSIIRRGRRFAPAVSLRESWNGLDRNGKPKVNPQLS